jgi:hypothetical protein
VNRVCGTTESLADVRIVQDVAPAGEEDGCMTIDLAAATAFMATHARLLDRRRFDRLVGDGDPDDVLAAVDAYRNSDGGYGWGLEPDLRSPESQPGGALHALEAFADAAPRTTVRATELCDWLASVSRPDGGLPFALPVTDPAGCAPFWAEADSAVSSLHITSAITAMAHRVARHDPAVAAHPWLAQATSYCLSAIEMMSDSPHALEVMFVLGFLDAIADQRAEALTLIDRVGRAIPADGTMHVGGGLEDELMRPLDFAPDPDRPVRRLFSADAIAADLARLGGLQADDGGWTVDFTSYSPMAALEWRGYATVRAVSILRRNS